MVRQQLPIFMGRGWIVWAAALYAPLLLCVTSFTSGPQIPSRMDPWLSREQLELDVVQQEQQLVWQRPTQRWSTSNRRYASRQRLTPRYPFILSSSFYGKFDEIEEDGDNDNDNEDEEEDDDDDDDYMELDDDAIANFRSRMSNMFGNDDQGTRTTPTTASVDDLIQFARSSSSDPERSSGYVDARTTTAVTKEWARATDTLREGVVLLANPAQFCTDLGRPSSSKNDRMPSPRTTPRPALLSKFGLTLPPPAELGPDRRADLLPVLMLVEHSNTVGSRAVLLNRRTGYLLGDLEQPSGPSGTPSPILEKFCIQPLWFGGVDPVSSSIAGLDMLHLCPAVVGAKQITHDGLFWGGDPTQAQHAMEDPALDRVVTGFDFKFFVQSTAFGVGELEREMKQKTFFVAEVSKEVLMKSRDRMGTRRAKPLWTEIMELMGGEYEQICNDLYDGQ